jgi:pilus assembly protein FimV
MRTTYFRTEKELNMVKRWLPSVATLSSLSMALLMMAPADAVELGNISLQSVSGQPLQATVQLSDTEGLDASRISVQVASAADFDRFSLERIAALDMLQIQVDFSGSTPVLRVSSPVTINEPFISLVLDTRWPAGRVLTEYTLRLESPAFSAQTGAPASVAPIRSVQEPLTDTVAQAPVVAVPEATASVSNAPVSTQASSQSGAGSQQTSQPASTAAQQAGAAAQPAAPVSNASTITVNAGDTLWALAQRVRPDSSVSVQQTMLAMQRLNPQAFIGGNINRVRRGEILQVPELSQIRQIAATEAVSEVNRQNQQLTAAASAVAAQPVTGAPSAAPAGAGAQGELRVVTVADDADNQQADASAAGNQSTRRREQIESLEDRISLGEENLARVDAQNEELNARLAMLQQQIASAQEIIRLRDLELAQLQQRLAEEGDTASADTPPTVITMAPDAGPFQRLMYLLTSNTWAMLGAAGVLVLLLVLLMMRRNRAAAESKAQISARENDSMSLGTEDDELLFSGVAEAAAESAASSAAAAEENASNGDAVAFYQLVEDSSEPADVLEKQIYNNKVQQEYEEGLEVYRNSELALPQATDLSEPEIDDDWQAGRLNSETTEFDDRFELDDTADSFDDKPAPATTAPGVMDASASEYDEFSSEDTGADLDWPDEDKAARVGDEFDISLTDNADEVPDSAPTPPGFEPEIKSTPAAKPASDDFDDLAFLPSEDDFTDQADQEDEEDFDFLSDSDEAATKLDLARAYIDMGDGYGAREILEEVLSEGTEVQRKEAQDLLGRL